MIDSLLRSQNRCIQTMLLLAEDFLKQTGSIFDRLDTLEKSRKPALRAYQLLEAKLTEAAKETELRNRTPELTQKLKSELQKRTELLAKLDRMNETIFSQILSAQQDLERDLTTFKKQKEMLEKFKSERGSNSGKGIDRTL